MGKYTEGNLDRVADVVQGADGYWYSLGAVTGGAATLTAASTTLYTPNPVNRLRLRWLALSSLSTGTECLVTVKMGTDVTYLWALPAPGAFSRRSARDAANVGDALVVLLDPTGGPVYVDYEVEELEP